MGKNESKKRKERLPEKQSSFVNKFRPRTAKQQEFVNLIESKEVVIALGPSGTGKSYCALATALGLLGDVYKKVILIKSVTTIPGEEIGFLPGGVGEKMEPFMMSYTWNIDKICGEGTARTMMHKKLIEVLPIAYIRGLSIDNAIVLIDESQNINKHTFKTIMTRIGTDSKYIFLGDIEQIDKKKKDDSCLETVVDIFKDSSIIGTVVFKDEDCVRNPIIPGILQQLREYNI